MSESSTFDQFCNAARKVEPSKPIKRKRPAPLSIRISEEQRARLKTEAAGTSVNAYVISKLFGESAAAARKAGRMPPADHAMLARVLGALGQSRLASNLNQIAKAANMGALPVTPELAAELHAACADIRAMRHDLMRALGLKPES